MKIPSYIKKHTQRLVKKERIGTNSYLSPVNKTPLNFIPRITSATVSLPLKENVKKPLAIDEYLYKLVFSINQSTSSISWPN